MNQTLTLLFKHSLAWLIGLLVILNGGRASSKAEESADNPTPPPFPIQVHAEVDVIKVSKIDDRGENYEVEIFLNQTWTDPRLTFDSQTEKASKRVVPIEEIWTPAIQLVNQIDATTDSGTRAHVFPDGRVLLHQAIKATIPTRFDLHSFPLDRHQLTIALESPIYETHEVTVLAKEIRLIEKKLDSLLPNGWKLRGLNTSTSSRTYPSIDETYSRAEFHILVQRDGHYYTWAVVLPLILIVATAWTTFWMEPSEFSTQVGVVITALLTIVAFKISVDSALPPLSYMTRIDLLFVLCQISVFTTLLLCIALKMLSSAPDPDAMARAAELRLRCRWLPMLVLLACCIPIPFVTPSKITAGILTGLGIVAMIARPTPRRVTRSARAILHPEKYLDPTARSPLATNRIDATESNGQNSSAEEAWTTSETLVATTNTVPNPSRHPLPTPHLYGRFRKS